MSWLFSQALVEEYSVATCSDGEPSAQLNVMLTPQQFWRNDKMMDCSKPSLFGLTSQPLMESHGEALLTWYREVSLARTSASLGQVMVSTASEADSGAKWGGSFARYSPGESLWKTAQCSFLEGLEPFSETWPTWGLMQGGDAYLQPIPVLHTCENAPGFWPTPTATLGSHGGRITEAKGREGGTLIEALSARMFPTPAARDYRSPNARSYAERGGGNKGEQLPNFIGGLLNPTFVEWLMGWPIGWTELKPLAMDKFQEWRQQHGAY